MSYYIPESYDGGFYHSIHLFAKGAAIDAREVCPSESEFLHGRLEEAQRLFQQYFGNKLFDIVVDLKALTSDSKKRKIPHIELKWDFNSIKKVAAEQVKSITGCEAEHKNIVGHYSSLLGNAEYFIAKQCNRIVKSLVAGKEPQQPQVIALEAATLDKIRKGLTSDSTRAKAVSQLEDHFVGWTGLSCT